MKKITKDIILDKKQHLRILDAFIQHSPHNLTLHDLTYLLTNKEKMYKIDLLQMRFGRSRKNIFKTRQRIQDCLTDLINLDLIHKRGREYRFNLIKIKELYLHISLYNQLEEIEKYQKKEFDEFDIHIKSLTDKEHEEYEIEFWKHHKKDFLKQYLPEK